MNKTKKWSDEKKYAILIFIIGLIMSFLVPTGQVPDEVAHLKMMGNSIVNENYFVNIDEDVQLSDNKIAFNYDEKVNKEEFFSKMKIKSDYQVTDMLPKGVSISVIKYFPAIIGTQIGIMLGLPSYWVLQIGEIFSLLFYAIICCFALKLMPVKKEAFGVFMMIPMALQQAGSISYDAVVLPVSFLFIAYTMHLKYKKEVIGLKDFLILMICWGVISLIKLPYAFIIGIILILPLDKIHICIGKWEVNATLIRKWRIPVIILGGIIGISVVYVLRDFKWIQLVVGMVLEPKRSLQLILQTIRVHYRALMVSFIGNFGWLDTPIPFIIALAVALGILLLTFVNSDVKYKVTIPDWLILWGTGGILLFFTFISMIDHSVRILVFGVMDYSIEYNIREMLYAIPHIVGLQGRYFLPFAFLFFLPVPQIGIVNGKILKAIIIIMEAILYLYVIYVLILRYWIG